MMLGAGTQQNIRKYIGAIKDSTTVGLAKVNSDYKELDIAIVKATNHFEDHPKEKHVRAIFAAISEGRPQADVVYCMNALAKRLAKTHNWVVALKTLIVVHRALREADPIFHEELVNYGRSGSHMLNLTHFRDDSSHDAWEYSSWVRLYALFLEERLECFRVLKYDIETKPSKIRDLNVVELLEQLPALQQLLFRLVECEPQGTAMHNSTIQLALSMVASESINVYNAINGGTINLVNKFFDMQPHIAVRALEIYRRAGQQVIRLSDFYDICKRMDIWPGEKFTKIEQSHRMLQTMEERVKNARSSARRDQVVDQNMTVSKEITQPEWIPETFEETLPASCPLDQLEMEASLPGSPDLLGLSDDDPLTDVLDEQNAMALGIGPVDDASISLPPNFGLENGTTSWESPILTVSSQIESSSASNKQVGGLDRFTLDSLYDEAMRGTKPSASCNLHRWQYDMANGS